MKIKIVAGNKFGRLTVLSPAEPYIEPGRGHRHRQWQCQCECGATTITRESYLKNGHAKSCGCHKRNVLATVRKTHGHSVGAKTTSTYNVWQNMHARCSNKKSKYYAAYGGRGITVCERWEKFKNFLEDMGERPEGKSLDRIDNDGHYEPGNCRWSTAREQARNRRSNRIVPYDGTQMCLTEAIELSGIPRSTVKDRLSRGLTPEEALKDA